MSKHKQHRPNTGHAWIRKSGESVVCFCPFGSNPPVLFNFLLGEVSKDKITTSYGRGNGWTPVIHICGK